MEDGQQEFRVQLGVDLHPAFHDVAQRHVALRARLMAPKLDPGLVITAWIELLDHLLAHGALRQKGPPPTWARAF